MTSAETYDFRTPTDRDKYDYPFLAHLQLIGKDPKLLDIKILQNAPDSEAEIRESFTDVFDGTTTPAVVDIVSASANDAADGTGIQTVSLLGIDEHDDLVEEEIDLAGTVAVTTTTKWKRLILLKAVAWGSGGTAAGAITVSETGGVSKCYMTLQASMSCVINSRVYLPDGSIGSVLHAEGYVVQSTGAAAVVVDKGATLRVLYVDTTTKTDEPIDTYPVIPNGDLKIDDVIPDKTGDGKNYFTLKHATINTGVNPDIFYRVKIAVWDA